MTRWIVSTLFIALVVCECCAYALAGASWRVGTGYVQPASRDVRKYDGGTHSFRLEYSFGDTFSGENTASDASVLLEITRVQFQQAGVRAYVDALTLGTNIRFGSGAKPCKDGFYAGFGLGYCYGSPSVRGLMPKLGGFDDGGSAEFTWRVISGVNWGTAMFTEADYSQVNRDGVLKITLGIRF